MFISLRKVTSIIRKKEIIKGKNNGSLQTSESIFQIVKNVIWHKATFVLFEIECDHDHL